MGTGRYKYETDRGNVFYCRTDNDPELAAIRGTPPAALPIEGLTFKSSRNAQEYGGSPRQAILTRDIGTEVEENCVADVAKRTKMVAVLTPAHAGTLVPDVTTVNVDGTTYKFRGMSDERIR